MSLQSCYDLAAFDRESFTEYRCVNIDQCLKEPGSGLGKYLSLPEG